MIDLLVRSILCIFATKRTLMRQKLIGRTSMDRIHELCILTQGERNDHRKEELYQLTFDEDERVAMNALWIFTHFDEANNQWLFQKHDDLIDRVLFEENATKRRLMFNLLLRQPFDEASLRSDFIDFCIEKITAFAQNILESIQALTGTTACKGLQIARLKNWAKENDCWIENPNTLGVYVDRGSENEVYMSTSDLKVYKLNDFRYSDDNLPNP